jgi:hypothetical protein
MLHFKACQEKKQKKVKKKKKNKKGLFLGKPQSLGFFTNALEY